MFSVCLLTGGGGVPVVHNFATTDLVGGVPNFFFPVSVYILGHDHMGARAVRLLRSRRRTVLLYLLSCFWFPNISFSSPISTLCMR